MRTLLTILIFLLPLGAAAIPCPETLECPAGTKFHTQDISRWCTKGDKPHGPQAICDRSGNLHVRDNYRNGVRHGRHQRFTSTGKLLIDENFVDGGVHGVSRSWHPGGRQLASEIEMKHGQQHGMERRWHPNGNLAKEAKFEDGKQVGRTRMWHPSGARLLIADFVDGQMHGGRQRYHANNWIYEVAEYDRGKLVGAYYLFAADGKVEIKGQYKDNLKVGEWLDDFGLGPATGRYEAGKKTGEWRFFTRDTGELREVSNYADDLLHGSFERFENGQTIEKGEHWHNLRHGVWTSFQQGKLQTRVTWDQGMLLETCTAQRRGKMKCVDSTPFRQVSVSCSTALPSSRFIDSQGSFDKLVTCHTPAPIDWKRHRVYVHREKVDPYAIRFSKVSRDGDQHVLVFEQHAVCYGIDPGPPHPRWIMLVLPRDIETLKHRVDQVPPTIDCSEVP